MFKSILQTILDEAPGSMGVFLLGDDGIVVEQVTVSPETAEEQLSLVVELSSSVNAVRQTAAVLESGALEEISICYEKLKLQLLVLNNEYFIVLLMQANAISAKGAYLLKREAGKLRAALNPEE